MKPSLYAQNMLLLPTLLSFPRHRIESFVQFAPKGGGDFWYAIDLGSACLVLVADAAGHGVAPALLTGVMRGAVMMLGEWIRSQPEMALDTPAILTRLNKIVFDSAQGSIPMSTFLAYLDPEREELTFSNAGHCFPYLISGSKADGAIDVSQLQLPGQLLGTQRDWVYAPELKRKVPWKKGHRLFLYSDGLCTFPTSTGESSFDRRKLVRALRHSATSPSLLKTFMEEHRKAVADTPQSDDLSAIVVEAL
jgi:phosphoserine phosphatase RsbU/P